MFRSKLAHFIMHYFSGRSFVRGVSFFLLFAVLSCSSYTVLVLPVKHDTGKGNIMLRKDRYLSLKSEGKPFAVINDYAVKSIQEGRSAEAKVLLEELTLLYPGSAAAWNNLGVANEYEGDLNAAFNCYVKACALEDEEILRYNLQNLPLSEKINQP